MLLAAAMTSPAQGAAAASALGKSLSSELAPLPGMMLPPMSAAQPEPAEPTDVGDQVASFFQGLRLSVLWQQNGWSTWIYLLVMIFLGLALGRLASTLISRLADRWQRSSWAMRAELLAGLAAPLNLLIFTSFLSVGMAPVVMSSELSQFVQKVLALLYTIVVFWVAYNLISLIDFALRRVLTHTHSYLDEQLVTLIRRTLRVFLLVIAVLSIAQNFFGADIGAWLAGLGIAGLAVSLAAQDSIKNLFGSVTILFDKPFKVGDRIVYQTYDGVVEDIGFRSTKMRTFTGSLVTIPNSNIVNNPVENAGVRPYIRRLLNVTLTYDTPPGKIEQAVKIIKDIFEREGIREPIYGPNPNLSDYIPPRVHFNEFNSESLNLMVWYWYRPVDWWGYLDHAQRFNMALLTALNEAQIEFAFPTRTLFMAGDPRRPLTLSLPETQTPLDDDAVQWPTRLAVVRRIRRRHVFSRSHLPALAQPGTFAL